jgi:hypothetical protein
MRKMKTALTLGMCLLAMSGGVNADETLELEGTSIIGNRELPKVLYIVPWKTAEIGDLEDRPVSSLQDEVLAPVDRDVFRRELRYYDQLKEVE